MGVQTIGSNKTAVGNIDIRTRGGATVYDRITAGGNRSLSGRFKVPNGYTGYLLGWNGSSANTNSEMRLRATRDCYTEAVTESHHFIDTFYIGSDSSFVYSTLPWLKIPALGEVKISCIPDDTLSTLYVSGAVKMLIISDT